MRGRCADGVHDVGALERAGHHQVADHQIDVGVPFERRHGAGAVRGGEDLVTLLSSWAPTTRRTLSTSSTSSTRRPVCGSGGLSSRCPAATSSSAAGITIRTRVPWSSSLMTRLRRHASRLPRSANTARVGPSSSIRSSREAGSVRRRTARSRASSSFGETGSGRSAADPEDDGHQVVEVVGDATGELPEHLGPPGTLQLSLSLHDLGAIVHDPEHPLGCAVGAVSPAHIGSGITPPCGPRTQPAPPWRPRRWRRRSACRARWSRHLRRRCSAGWCGTCRR